MKEKKVAKKRAPGGGRKPGEPKKVLYRRVPLALYDQCTAAIDAILKAPIEK